jgi:hypothetical protein
MVYENGLRDDGPGHFLVSKGPSSDGFPSPTPGSLLHRSTVAGQPGECLGQSGKSSRISHAPLTFSPQPTTTTEIGEESI